MTYVTKTNIVTKKIKSIVDQVQFYLGKQESGEVSVENILRELNTESYNVFDELVLKYAETRIISEFLQPFHNITDPTTIQSGNMNKPEGFQHATGIILEDGTPVEILERGMYNLRLNHPNKPPTTSYPICIMYLNKIQFAPADLDQKAILSYFKEPTQAVYATEISGDEYVYNDNESVDFEWDHQTIIDRIVMRTLANFGVPLKDGELIQYSQIEEAKDRQ